MLRLRAVTKWATLAWVAVACAQATTINFTATVTSTNLNNFSNGQVVQGSLTFDASTPGLPQFDGTRIYTGAVTTFQLAGLQLTGPQNQNSISVLPFTVSGFNDVFDAKIGSATSTLEFYLESYKSTGTLGNGVLPTMPFSLSAFQDSSTYFSTYVQFADYANGYSHLDANLTSFNPAAIPEPSSLALLTLAAAGMGAPLLRRLTQRSNKKELRKVMRIATASFCLSVSLVAGLQAQVPPQPLTYSVGIQPDGSVVVPSDQVLTPAGTQIILPLCRANAVTIRPGGHTAAVLAKPANSKPIRIIDIDKGTELQEFAPSSGPTAASYAGIIYSADGNTLYASQDSGNILIANVAADGTLTFRSQLSIPQPVKGANPGALALSADGNTLYVVLNTYNTLGVFDLASGTLVSQIPVENAPRDIVIVGGFAYVSNEGGRVAIAGDFTMNGRDNAAILLGAPNMTSYGGPAGTLKSTDIYTPIVADPVTGAATTGSSPLWT